MGSTTIVQTVPAHGMPPDTPPPDAVREQLGRILASPLFRNSKHYPNLLKHVVEQTLAGRTASLKERALGMEVFGRDPHYDTNADPVVRTSACEVRKRIALYYHDPNRGAEIRIELPTGSYVAEFHFPELHLPPVEIPVEPAPVVEPEAAPRRLARYRARFGVAGPAMAVAAVVVTAVALASGVGRSKSPTELFWGPVWAGTDSVLVCLGVFKNPPRDGSAPSADPTHTQVMWSDRVAFADAVTMAKLTGLLQAHSKQYEIRGSSTLALEDLHKSPAVLIGAFDNPWTLALTHHLRFFFEFEPASGKPVIRDLQHPTQVNWRGDFQRPYSEVTEDYAIISRYVDPQVERMVVAVAGMGKDGTAAGGEFVTESKYLETLASAAPPNWDHKNLQVVIATKVINGNSGPPRVLATWFW